MAEAALSRAHAPDHGQTREDRAGAAEPGQDLERPQLRRPVAGDEGKGLLVGAAEPSPGHGGSLPVAADLQPIRQGHALGRPIERPGAPQP